ncbi:hypothetical protein CANARDRAFT_203776 [[Candida] arabinofermentans NRRL YB-2248]|uniref:Uncharacterized protein n=1 Tax=[Candida] arabinofermentans NRRL YB-2248 TaxID=983967 RepID=A0A1E4SUM5_9ASCO|nr:hypothetical protein CANARDRAFT_203776 [[Candida] arabinofermentans NRRL YB-2248]
MNLNTNNSTPSNKFKNTPKIITPRIIENQLGESLKFRDFNLSNYKELGPPDLINISRYDKDTKKQYGEYHYCIGINTSSTAQPLMYLQTLQLNDVSIPSLKHPKFATYCSFNCFTKGDLRISCEYPSGLIKVQFYLQPNEDEGGGNSKGKNYFHDVKDDDFELWNEIYVSSLIRSILFSDDIERQLPGMCKFNPIQSKTSAKFAICSIISMIPKGVLCGSSDLVSQPTIMNNNLIDALIKLISITNLYDLAIDEIIRLESKLKGLNCSILKVKLLLLKGDQIKSVQLMYDSIKLHSRDGLMLIEQSKFLISQNRADLALGSSIRAVECLPTEFQSWKLLIQVHILNKDYTNALLALNSSPMYSNKKKDIFPALKPKSFEFPLPLEGKIEKIWLEDCETFGCISGIGEIIEFSPSNHLNSINNLHLNVYEQTKLQSTFKEAYDLLAIMVKHIGWTELLKLRSKVFVMEDEYNEIIEGEGEEETDINQLTVNNGSGMETNGRGRSTSINSHNGSIRSTSIVSKKFKTKRLSERWLDSLFLIFYENLKSVLIWENERSNGGGDLSSIQHTALEWELIGDECFKVRRFESGLIPFRTCLDSRFSIFSAYKLLNYFINYNSNETEFMKLNLIKNESRFNNYKLNHDFILKLICKLISWNYRYYGEFSIVIFKVLKILINADDSDSVLIKSKLEIFYENEPDKNKIVSVVDKYINWIEQFEN